MKFGRYVTVDDGGNYVTVHELNVRRIIRHNESLGRLSNTHSVKNETSQFYSAVTRFAKSSCLFKTPLVHHVSLETFT